MNVRCEGWRRNGGMMTLGPVEWKQCENLAEVVLKVKQDGKKQELPACLVCWDEAVERGIEILSSKPLKKTKKAKKAKTA